MLEIENISKSYRGIEAVSAVSFAVAPGEIVGMQSAAGTMRELMLLAGAAALLTELSFYTFREVPFTANRLRRRGTPLPLLAFVGVVLPLAFVEILRCETAVAASWMAAGVWVLRFTS